MSTAIATLRSLEDRIIDVLIREPRASFRQLAADAGINEATARSHVLRLIADGTLDIRGHAHPLAAPDRIMFSATMTYESVDLIDLDHPALDGALWVIRDSLRPVIMAELRAGSIDDLGGVVDSLSDVPGVDHVSLYTLFRLHAGIGSDGDAEAGSGHWGDVPSVRIDAVDQKILDILGRDGRASYTDVGRSVGLSVQAARRRILLLVQQGILRFATYVRSDRRAFHHALMRCVVRSGHRQEFLNEVTGMNGVASVAEVTSDYPYVGELRTDTAEELAALVRRLKALDVVIDIRVDPILVLRDQRVW